MGWGLARSAKYAVTSAVAMTISTAFLDGLELFGERRIDFRGAVRIPQPGSGATDVTGWFGFVRDTVLMPLDIVILFVNIMDIWLQMAFETGPFAVVMLLVVLPIVLFAAVLLLEAAGLIASIIDAVIPG